VLDGSFSIDVWFLWRRRRETRLGGICIYRWFCKWLMSLVIGQKLVDFGAVVTSSWWWLIPELRTAVMFDGEETIEI